MSAITKQVNAKTTDHKQTVTSLSPKQNKHRTNSTQLELRLEKKKKKKAQM